MKLRQPAIVVFVCTASLFATGGPAAAQPPEAGQGWLPEFTLASRQILQLAEATPEDRFAWRPGPGVRSIGEVYVHIAVGNILLLERAGVQPAIASSAIPRDPEKTITKKADVIAWLKKSFDAVRAGYQAADRQQKVTLFGRETTSEDVFLRILVHNHEHMGQSVAYVRMNGLVPPWSRD